MKFRIRTLAAAFVLSAAGCAIAQADQGATQTKSLLSVLMEGAEWPGLVIAAMSLAAVTIVIEHFWTIRRKTMLGEAEVDAARDLIEQRKFKECLDLVTASRTMFSDVLTAGLRHGRHGFDAMSEAANERAGAWSSRLFRKVEYLNIIGNLGPLMGLLGTVLGMIRAFGEMRASHGAYKPEDLAGGISLALVNTFLGLLVAIVALGFFGICRNRVDALTVTAHAAAMDLLEYFRPANISAPAANHESTKPEGQTPKAAPKPKLPSIPT